MDLEDGGEMGLPVEQPWRGACGTVGMVAGRGAICDKPIVIYRNRCILWAWRTYFKTHMHNQVIMLMSALCKWL